VLGASLRFEDVAAEASGAYPHVMYGGDMDAGAWGYGMVAGLMHDVPTVPAMIDCIMAETRAIVRQRLEVRLGKPVSALAWLAP
jgi:nitronate monooxygenase